MQKPIDQYKDNARRSKYLCGLLEEFHDLMFVYERNGSRDAIMVDAKMSAIKIELDGIWENQMELLDKIKPFEDRVMNRLKVSI